METDSTIAITDTSDSEVIEYSVLSQEIEELAGNSVNNILVIENDMMSAFLIKTILQKNSISFQLITNEKDLLSELKEKYYKLILVGINEPENYELFNQLEDGIRKGSKTVFVGMTTLLTKNSLTLDQKEKLDHILIKPYEIAELIRLINLHQNQNNTGEKLEMVQEPKFSFNLEQLKQVSNNNQEFISKMLDKFLTTALEAEESMATGILAGDWGKLKKTAHKCIPSYSVLGLNELVEQLEYIESNVLEHNENEALHKTIELFIQENKKLITEIHYYIEH